MHVQSAFCSPSQPSQGLTLSDARGRCEPLVLFQARISICERSNYDHTLLGLPSIPFMVSLEVRNVSAIVDNDSLKAWRAVSQIKSKF
jgi:hypothetical protein